jgi:cytochrome c553
MAAGKFSMLMKSGRFVPSAGLRKCASIAFALVLSLAPLTARGAPACGAPGKPACPFQSFMRTRLATAFAHRDLRELERRLAEVAERNPEPAKWHNWSKFARDGARAAHEGRLSGVVAACARCHAIYRPEFNVKYRERPLVER